LIGAFDTGAGVRIGGAHGSQTAAPDSGYQHFRSQSG
jgi:hypothetical protein